MRTIRLLVMTALITLSAVIVTHAQKNYNTAIGVRLGPTAGITFKQFVNSTGAFEGILSTRWHGFIFSGLYEWHHNVFNNRGFNLYYGVGGHIGFWDVGRYNHPWYDDDGHYTALGVDGILGLEYSFSEVPINLSVDWKPMLNLVNYTGLWVDDVGLSVRIHF